MEELLTRGFQDLVLFYQSPNSSVYRASHPSCPKCTPQVAIKLQRLPSPAALQHAFKEVVIMESLQRHPYIIQLCEYFESRAPDGSCMLAIVTEWGEKDLMQDMVQRKTNEFPWSEEDFRYIAFSVVHALGYAERLGIAHRDIKPQNIFYSPITKVAKLGDFGSATNIYSRLEASLVGTPAYMSAELRTGMRQGAQRVIHDMVKSDVYSLGLTLLVLANLQPPAMGLDSEKQVERVQQIVTSLAYSEQVKWLLWEMVNPDCELRPTFMQFESKYCPLEENRPLPLVEPIRPVIDFPQPVQSEPLPYPQPQHPEITPESPVINVLNSQPAHIPINPPVQPEPLPYPQHPVSTSKSPTIIVPESQPPPFPVNQTDLFSAHLAFQCCGNPQLALMPVHLLCSSSGILRFCKKSCYVQFAERETREYTKMQINCPICQGVIQEREILEPFGGDINHYREKNFRKGLKCVSCKQRQATHTIECGHLYCKPCLDLYKPPILQQRKYICADCGLVSTKKAKKCEKKHFILKFLFCGGERSHGSEDA